MAAETNLGIFWHYSALCPKGSLITTIQPVIEILHNQGHFNCILSDRTPSSMEHWPCPYHKLTYKQEGLQYGPLIERYSLVMEEHLPHAIRKPKDYVLIVGGNFDREHPTDIPLLYVNASKAVTSTQIMCFMNELTHHDSVTEAHATLEERASGGRTKSYTSPLIQIEVGEYRGAGDEPMMIPTMGIYPEER